MFSLTQSQSWNVHLQTCLYTCPLLTRFFLRSLIGPQITLSVQGDQFFFTQCYHPHTLRESVSPVCGIFILHLLASSLRKFLNIIYFSLSALIFQKIYFYFFIFPLASLILKTIPLFCFFFFCLPSSVRMYHYIISSSFFLPSSVRRPH